MRLGDFRKETADMSDDVILDEMMFIQWLPAHYDGRPNEYLNHENIYQNEPKIRIYKFDSLEWFWDCCEPNKTYDENRDMFMKKFIRGENIEDDRWDNYVMTLKHRFDEYWNASDWQEYLKENKNA